MKTLEDALAAIEQMKADHEAEKAALKNKNSELIDRERAAKDRAEELESASGTELEKMQKRAEKAERDLKAAQERADASAKTLRDFRADNAINAALASANVDSKHVALLAKALRADVEFSDDGEPLISGKPVDAYAKSFFAKDGLSYVRAQNNSGGLATGNDGSGASTLMKAPETADEYNTFFKLTITDKAQANALAEQWGRDDLKS